MLKISRLADYASLVMNFLANHRDKPLSASAVAEQTHITAPTVSKVLKQLNEAGLLSSTRGANGGYQLARDPEQITVAEIIAAIDGNQAVTQCSVADGCCDHIEHCGLQGNWQFINTAIYELLNSIYLSDMLRPMSEEVSIPLLLNKLPIVQRIQSEAS